VLQMGACCSIDQSCGPLDHADSPWSHFTPSFTVGHPNLDKIAISPKRYTVLKVDVGQSSGVRDPCAKDNHSYCFPALYCAMQTAGFKTNVRRAPSSSYGALNTCQRPVTRHAFVRQQLSTSAHQFSRHGKNPSSVIVRAEDEKASTNPVKQVMLNYYMVLAKNVLILDKLLRIVHHSAWDW
jgi:hypothetical protein